MSYGWKVYTLMAKNKKLKVPKAKAKKISKGTEKLVEQWKKTGSIKTSRAVYHPKTLKAAIDQALAIKYGKHGVGRAGKKKS